MIKLKRGGSFCCVPGCSNYNNKNRNISWHSFPKDTNTREEWVRRVNRKGKDGEPWKPKNHDVICGIHFNPSGKKKYEDKLPRFFPWKTFTVSTWSSQSPSAKVSSALGGKQQRKSESSHNPSDNRLALSLHHKKIYSVQEDKNNPGQLRLVCITDFHAIPEDSKHALKTKEGSATSTAGRNLNSETSRQSSALPSIKLENDQDSENYNCNSFFDTGDQIVKTELIFEVCPEEQANPTFNSFHEAPEKEPNKCLPEQHPATPGSRQRLPNSVYPIQLTQTVLQGQQDSLDPRIPCLEDPDIAFGQYVVATLKSIQPNSRKDLAKLQIQQVLFKYQHSLDASSSEPSQLLVETTS